MQPENMQLENVQQQQVQQEAPVQQPVAEQMKASLDTVLVAVDEAMRRCYETRDRLEEMGSILETTMPVFKIASTSSSFQYTPEQIEAFKISLGKLKQTIKILAADHRESHVFLSRLGKTIDKHFDKNFSNVIKPDEYFTSIEGHNIMNEAIVHFLYKYGFEDIAVTFARESTIDEDEFLKESLEDIRRILEAIRQHNPGPVFDWVYRQKRLVDRKSLLLKLHKVMFRQIALRDGDMPAIHYAQRHFPQFSRKYPKEIGQVMSLLVRDVYNSFTILDTQLWFGVAELFLLEISHALKFPANSGLQLAIVTGCQVISSMLNLQEELSKTSNSLCSIVMENSKISSLSEQHSVFSCPILREVCSKTNPPMRLTCGHAISKNAINRLTINRKIKCPYCPVVSEQRDTKRLYFY